jgi:hypothetical protein
MFGQKLSVVEEDGTKVGKSEPIKTHEFNGKQIETGFFKLPNAENVSAVIFSNAATLAKFDRLGVPAGFKPSDRAYVRQGFMFDPDPEAFEGIPFRVDITNPRYQEFWGDEVQVFHNPNAKNPLPWDAFPDAVHFGHEDGEIISRDRPGRVLSSQTIIIGTERELVTPSPPTRGGDET